MATYYVWSGATGTGDGSSFANAYTTLPAANTARLAGDVFIVADDHQEDLTATLGFRGTFAAPNKVIVANRTSGLPVRMSSSTGYIGTAGTTELRFEGFVETYGLKLRPGGGSATTNAATTSFGILGNCQQHIDMDMDVPNNAACAVRTASGPAAIEFRGLQVTNGNARVLLQGQTGSQLLFNNCPALFSLGGSAGIISTANNGSFVFQGASMLNQASGVLFGSAPFGYTNVTFESCAVHSTMNIVPASHTQSADLLNCVDESGNVRHERRRHGGNLTRNAAVFRTGGANDGVTPFSWRVATNANLVDTRPLETFDLTFFVPPAKVGVSTTVTVHTVTDNVTLTDADCSLLVGASVTASSTIHTFTETKPDPLETPANLATSTEAWTTTGLTTPVYQQMVATFTPTRTGLHRLKVRVRRPSTTLFICPSPVIA